MIRFPELHIAESVVNRILATHDHINAKDSATTRAAAEPPMLPDTHMEGATLDLELMQPTPPVGELPQNLGGNSPSENIFESTVSGGTPYQGLLDGISVG